MEELKSSSFRHVVDLFRTLKHVKADGGRRAVVFSSKERRNSRPNADQTKISQCTWEARLRRMPAGRGTGEVSLLS